MVIYPRKTRQAPFLDKKQKFLSIKPHIKNNFVFIKNHGQQTLWLKLTKRQHVLVAFGKNFLCHRLILHQLQLLLSILCLSEIFKKQATNQIHTKKDRFVFTLAIFFSMN